VAAVSTIDGATYATLNANVLQECPAFSRPPATVEYDRESAVERIARRRRAWTPVLA
jgi:hypothetical protein